MGSRMDKYKNNHDLPKRSDLNKKLYEQIYNAYDEFENLVVPSNVKEIDLKGLKKEITTRDEYKQISSYKELTDDIPIQRETIKKDKLEKETEIYDIKELLDKAVKDNKKEIVEKSNISSDEYLKRLKLNETKTNLETVKEMYDDIKKETAEESEELLKTANLSLDILSDLRGENDDTMINPPIKDEYMPEESKRFYSGTFKFNKKDFEDKKLKENVELEDLNENTNKIKKSEQSELDDFYDNEMSEDNGKFFFKILLLIFGLILVVVVGIYLISYLNRV